MLFATSSIYVEDFEINGMNIENYGHTSSYYWRIGRGLLLLKPGFGEVDFVFDMEERAHLCPADGALVRLHTDDLAAVYAEAHVAARQHHRVLRRSVADHALLLALVCQVGCAVVNTIDVVQVHDLVIVEELLLLVFVLEGEAGIGRSFELVHAHGRLVLRGSVLLEVAVGELAVLLATTPVISRIDSLNLNHNGAKVTLGSEYIEVL